MTIDVDAQKQAPGEMCQRKEITIRIQKAVSNAVFNSTNVLKTFLNMAAKADPFMYLLPYNNEHDATKIKATEFITDEENFKNYTFYEKCKPANHGWTHFIFAKIDTAVSIDYIRSKAKDVLQAKKLYVY